MAKCSLYYFCLPFLTIMNAQHSFQLSPHPKLLIISLDGLSYDHLTEKTMPNLWNFGKQGVRFESGIRSQYFTSTAPNHMSLVTGLHVESHGIVGNKFYDPTFKEFWKIWDDKNDTTYRRSKMSFWYEPYNLEPLWLTNQRAATDRFSGQVNWPEGDIVIKGKKATWFRTQLRNDKGILTDLPSWKKDFDLLLSYFLKPDKPGNLGLLHIPYPDHTMHFFGVNSKQTKGNLTDLDTFVSYIIEKLDQSGLKDINLVFTADHGLADLKQNPKTGLSWSVNKVLGNLTKDLIIADSHIYFPASSKTDMNKVYQRLKSAQDSGELPIYAYRKEDFPNQNYHYTNTPRVGPVFWVAKFPYNVNKHEVKLKATHSFFPDHPVLRAHFVAKGPAFRENTILGSSMVENIDLYPLFCEVLQIEPRPNNGTFDRVKRALKSTRIFPDFDHKLGLIVVLVIVLPAAFFLVYFMSTVCNCSAKNKQSQGYRKIRDDNQQKASNFTIGDLSTSDEF